MAKAKKKSKRLRPWAGPRLQLYPSERLLGYVQKYQATLSVPISMSQVACALLEERFAQMGYQDELPLTEK